MLRTMDESVPALSKASPRGLSLRERRRWRESTAITPTWWQRLRSLVLLVLVVAALGAALAAIIGTIAIAGALVLDRLTA